MFEDRKIRKALEEEMKPSKSFEQFCLENGLNYVPAAKPAPKKTCRHLKWILPTVAGVIAILVCGIFLPMFISPVKYYSADAVERVKISQEEFLESDAAAVLDGGVAYRHARYIRNQVAGTRRPPADCQAGCLFKPHCKNPPISPRKAVYCLPVYHFYRGKATCPAGYFAHCLLCRNLVY